MKPPPFSDWLRLLAAAAVMLLVTVVAIGLTLEALT